MLLPHSVSLSRIPFPQTVELALRSFACSCFLWAHLLFKSPLVTTLSVLCCGEKFQSYMDEAEMNSGCIPGLDRCVGLGFHPGHKVLPHGARMQPTIGGLRRWGSSIPCCLPLVKTSNSKGLARQRMSLSTTWEGQHCAGPHLECCLSLAHVKNTAQKP